MITGFVRHKSGVPVAADFGSADGGPLIINTATGDLYALNDSGVLVKIGVFAPVVPALTQYTSGSGTYTTPAGALYLTVEQVAGGGGGAGSGTGAGNGTAGGNTTFGSSFLTCNGGGAGSASSASEVLGGTATGGDINMRGGSASGANGNVNNPGGSGGISFFGGVCGLITPNQSPGTVVPNTGAGGNGAACAGTINSGGGGSAGGYLRKIIASPAASYAYSVGAAGAAGSAGTGGTAGAAGAAGGIIVIAFFQ